MADPLSLDAAAAYEWRAIAGQVMHARRTDTASSTNPTLQAAIDRDPQSPAVRAYLLWIADNLGIDKQYREAIAAYDLVLASTVPPFIANYNEDDGPRDHKAQVAMLAGLPRLAIDTWRDLADIRPDDPEPLLWAGLAAEHIGDRDLAADLYGARMAPALSRQVAAPQLALRAHARLNTPDAAFSDSADRVADALMAALENGDVERLRDLASKTHFAIGPAGGHSAFESDEMLEHLFRELKASSVTARRALGGRGAKRYLHTSGWRGRWYRGDLFFMITRAPRGWQWTGLALTGVTESWAEHAQPVTRKTNDPLPFPIAAPWPKGLCFRAGGILDADFIAQNAAIAALITAGSFFGPFGAAVGAAAGYALAVGFASSDCGFGLRGFYFHDNATHSDDNAFAIDFMRCRRYVPYINSSGGTPVLAVRDGIVMSVHGFGETGSDKLNRILIAHADPENPSDETRYSSRYLHMEGPMVDAPSELMPVITGNRIGRMDSTGENSPADHLHFSMHDRQLTGAGYRPHGGSVRPTPMAGTSLEDEDSGKCVCSTTIEREGPETMIEIADYAGQNWLITPAATAVGQAPPSSIEQQLYLLVLSGVAVVEFKGNSGSSWRRDTVALRPDLQAPLIHAANRHGLPIPSGIVGSDFRANFRVEQWAPFAALSSIYNEDESNDSGFAVNVWRPNPFFAARDFFTGQSVDKLFAGIQVDVAARDTDAFVKRLSYKITLLGKIVFNPNIIL